MGETDQELLQQMSEGDENAFTALYGRRQPAVYRYALHMSGNEATAEEITQDVFLVLLRSPANYDASRGTLASYLYGVARNLLRRRRIEDQRNVELGDEHQVAGRVVERLEREQEIGLLRRALHSLPWRYREAVVLCELQEMNYDEAARVSGCAIGTIRSRLHRARALLEGRLRKSFQRCAT